MLKELYKKPNIVTWVLWNLTGGAKGGAHVTDVTNASRTMLMNLKNLWDVLVEPARKIRVGNKLYFGENQSLIAEVIDNTTSRGRTLRFLYDGTHDEFKAALFAMGRTSLPPYIKHKVDPNDTEMYQTIFASEEGAVVAPFAGLRFSQELKIFSSLLTSLNCTKIGRAHV